MSFTEVFYHVRAKKRVINPPKVRNGAPLKRNAVIFCLPSADEYGLYAFYSGGDVLLLDYLKGSELARGRSVGTAAYLL